MTPLLFIPRPAILLGSAFTFDGPITTFLFLTAILGAISSRLDDRALHELYLWSVSALYGATLAGLDMAMPNSAGLRDSNLTAAGQNDSMQREESTTWLIPA